MNWASAYKDSNMLCDGINDVCLCELPGETTEENVGEILILGSLRAPAALSHRLILSVRRWDRYTAWRGASASLDARL